MARKKKKSNWDNLEPQKSSAAQFLTYVASVGNVDERYEIRYEDENIWMSQKMLAQVYGVEVPNIAYHLRKLFADAELDKNSVIKEILITADDGKNYRVNHYDLRVIIALGFKIDNEKAIAFRKWANQIVTEYTIKGWMMDDQRLEDFLVFYDRRPQPYPGDPVTAYQAQLHAETEFEKYKIVQDKLFMSDYDRYLLELEEQARREKEKGEGGTSDFGHQT